MMKTSAASSLNWFLLAALASLSELLIFVFVLASSSENFVHLLHRRRLGWHRARQYLVVLYLSIVQNVFVPISKSIFILFCWNFFYITFAVFPNLKATSKIITTFFAVNCRLNSTQGFTAVYVGDLYCWHSCCREKSLIVQTLHFRKSSDMKQSFKRYVDLDEKYFIALLSKLNFFEECPYTSQRGNT